jgi:hypothetical protein
MVGDIVAAQVELWESSSSKVELMFFLVFLCSRKKPQGDDTQRRFEFFQRSA